jgi:daunorubicin/doxorubicin transport system permease protein
MARPGRWTGSTSRSGAAKCSAFVKVNPISHLTEAARDLMNNTSGAGAPAAWSLIATAAITLVFAPITLHLYSKQW